MDTSKDCRHLLRRIVETPSGYILYFRMDGSITVSYGAHLIIRVWDDHEMILEPTLAEKDIAEARQQAYDYML